MILTVLGGGGFRVPLVYAALLADRGPGRVSAVRLFDTDARRLRAIAQVLARQAAGSVDAPTVSVHTDLAEALTGTDVIFSAIRVGGLQGRVCDERVALDAGVIGQETVGPGGIAYALRTIPVAAAYAEQIRRLAPDAWLINFTNPAGMITEAMQRVLPGRVIGICDSPVGLVRRAVRTLEGAGLVPEDHGPARPRYAGLNHLGWLTGVEIDGDEVLPRLLAEPALLTSFEEGRLFGADWLQTLGCLPNEYLHYYAFTREQLAADRAGEPRGAYLADQQERFYARFDDGAGPVADPLAAWDQARLERERTYLAANRSTAGGFDRDADDLQSGGYELVALSIMHAIGRNEPAELIINVPNHGTLPELDDDAVIEVPCTVDAAGPVPLPGARLPDHGRGLVVTIKQVERYVLEAATTGSARAALLALATHPLVDSAMVARRLLAEYRSAQPELGYLS